MTLAEKASLCSGENNWSSKAIERLGIPSVYMTDGPHGLRREADDGFGNSMPATCFPTAACLAASWNTELLAQVGEAIGEECQAQGVQILLGPGANIKRSPLNGRNFEYFSEDPKVSGEMAAALIQGIQSQGVGTSLKHFVANNQEFERMSINAVVDERALREIYLSGFEIAVKKAQPYTMMCAYNKINETFASENKYLLHEILKKEWQYEGIVLSDWGAVHHRPSAVEAGLHLEMPGNGGINDQEIVKAVQTGTLSEERLDEVVGELLNVVFRVIKNRKTNATFDAAAHHQLAQKASAEGIVLLKNEKNTLPLQPHQKIAVIGQFAKTPRYQGSGSSLVKPTQIDNAYEELEKLLGHSARLTYASGYNTEHETEDSLLANAKATAKNADIAVVFIGLPESFETEGTDRKHLCLPESHNALMAAVTAVQPNTIVVLFNGSPVEMPWETKVNAILEGWLGGQGGGKAIAEVLLGEVNPSGKLTETFPLRLEDSPSFLHYPGTAQTVQYGESIFVGYRYFDIKKIKPLFPFGHGLSYTRFEYSDLKADKTAIGDKESIKITMTVSNIGKRKGKEIVQLYLKDVESTVIRPVKELKAFAKIELEAGASGEVSFVLNRRDFAFYEANTKSWKVETGDFEIQMGASVEDIRQIITIKIHTVENAPANLTKYSTCKEFLAHPKGAVLVQPIYDEMIGFFTRSIPADQPEKKKDITQFFVYILNDLPFYKLETFSSGHISRKTLEEIVGEVKN